MRTKQHKEIFESDGYIYYLDFGDGIITGYTYIQTYQMIYINYVQGVFVCQLYLNKGTFISWLLNLKNQQMY